MNQLKNLNVLELDEHQLKKIDGGSILEAIAWLYGLASGTHERNASLGRYDDIDWEKKRVLVGG